MDVAGVVQCAARGMRRQQPLSLFPQALPNGCNACHRLRLRHLHLWPGLAPLCPSMPPSALAHVFSPTTTRPFAPMSPTSHDPHLPSGADMAREPHTHANGVTGVHVDKAPSEPHHSVPGSGSPSPRSVLTNSIDNNRLSRSASVPCGRLSVSVLGARKMPGTKPGSKP